MSRRVGTLLLAAFVALGGRALCPDGVGSCLRIEVPQHDCCARDAALATHDCCCKGSRNAADAQDATRDRTAQISQTAHAVALVDGVATLDAATAMPALMRPGSAHGPPETLVSHHTALLL
ncbi:hypothetical protein L6Q96_02125 [Candidatus Binatia bacterium]|nr:hypothetical protein [Candidatus Binatia bacterium]